jgi:molybdopterin-guanine dinucleotide biosynthesis protein A
MAGLDFTQDEQAMSAHAGISIAAVILAGGRGERLGGAVKANLRVGGVRLIDRVLARVSQCSPIVVAHGPHDGAALALPAGVVGVNDLPSDYAGPLAGFVAAVAVIPAEIELLVCAAVDSPFLPVDYVARLLTALGDAPAAIAQYEGQPCPTSSIWRLSQFRDLPARVLAGSAPRSLKALASACGARTAEWAQHPWGDPFASINTPEDLQRAEALAAGAPDGF